MAKVSSMPGHFTDIVHVEDLVDAEITAPSSQSTLVYAEDLVDAEITALSSHSTVVHVEEPLALQSLEFQQAFNIQELVDLFTWHAVTTHAPSYYICPAYKILLGDEE